MDTHRCLPWERCLRVLPSPHSGQNRLWGGWGGSRVGTGSFKALKPKETVTLIFFAFFVFLNIEWGSFFRVGRKRAFGAFL